MTQLNLSDAAARLPRRPVGDLKAGERVDQVFLVTKKDLRAASNGSLYIHAIVSDKTGEMVARMWQATEDIFSTIPDGGLLRIAGRVDSYKGNPQLIIDSLRPADLETIDVSEFMPATKHDIREMFEQIKKHLSAIKDADLRRLISAVLADETMMTEFRRSPAAVRNHHAFIGGLLEHTLSLLGAARRLLPHYPQVNADLVLAGIFLHDIGKTRELSSAMGFEYTDEGHLIGHIYVGAQYVQQKAAELADAGEPVNPEALRLLLHIILSHHGQMEFGAPVLPKTREAFMVHYLDNLDAKINTFDRVVAGDSNQDAGWSQYESSLGRRLYKRDYAGPESSTDADKPRKGGLE
ncbi:MAG: 3'-5' exoribonuclease YhaM [Phycisphaerae bacterium]|nr:3'-5' exoribonuclease YhaM [Phycisphaerae bacterium]